MVQQALSKGVEMHVAGEFELASQLYGSVIKLDPNHADANHNMWLLKVDTGDVLEAKTIYLKVPLKELRRRDPKKIYQRYDAGELKNVAGLDLYVDEPLNPHVTLDFVKKSFLWRSPELTVEYLISELEKVGFNITV